MFSPFDQVISAVRHFQREKKDIKKNNLGPQSKEAKTVAGAPGEVIQHSTGLDGGSGREPVDLWERQHSTLCLCHLIQQRFQLQPISLEVYRLLQGSLEVRSSRDGTIKFSLAFFKAANV